MVTLYLVIQQSGGTERVVAAFEDPEEAAQEASRLSMEGGQYGVEMQDMGECGCGGA